MTFDLDAFLSDCRAAMAEAQPTLAIKEVVERATSRAADVVHALGEPQVSDMRVLYGGPDITVCHAVWAPCMSIHPHNHNMPAVIGIYGGAEDNTFWQRHEHGLKPAGGRELRAGEVSVFGPDVIHSVANPKRQYTAALHVYLGDYVAAERSEWDPETFEERPFNLETSRRVFAAADLAWKEAQSEDAAR